MWLISGMIYGDAWLHRYPADSISIVAIGPSIISYLGLLQKEPEKRLGSGESDGAELRTHAW